MRQRLHWLSRCSRLLAHQTQTLQAGLFIVGCLDNFCDHHDSLRLKLAVGEHGFRWVQRGALSGPPRWPHRPALVAN
jgi:hypothetical protein